MVREIRKVERSWHLDRSARDLRVPCGRDPGAVGELGIDGRPDEQGVPVEMIEGQSSVGAGVACLDAEKNALHDLRGDRP